VTRSADLLRSWRPRVATGQRPLQLRTEDRNLWPVLNPWRRKPCPSWLTAAGTTDCRRQSRFRHRSILSIKFYIIFSVRPACTQVLELNCDIKLGSETGIFGIFTNKIAMFFFFFKRNIMKPVISHYKFKF